MSAPITVSQHIINAATATTTSAPIKVNAFRFLSLFVKRSNHSAGTSTFTVEVSCDYEENGSAATWVTYNKLVTNVTNTNAQNFTRVASVALNSDSSAFVTFDSTDAFTHVRVTVTEGTDGTHDAWLVYKS